MRKRMLMIGAVIIALLLGGCDPYSGRYPYNYGSAKWSSENPEIVFYTSPETGPYSKGTLYDENTEVPLLIEFIRQTNVVVFYTDEEHYNELLRGEWVLESDKLIVKVTGGKELKDQYEEIVFNRTVD